MALQVSIVHAGGARGPGEGGGGLGLGFAVQAGRS